jgi:predicted enzyme related to lactoylglutathione lyase
MTSPAPSSTARLVGLTFVAVYVDDYASAFAFYTDTLGLEKSFDMGPDSCYLKLTDDVGLYLEGGNTASSAATPETVRASFGLTAESVVAMHRKLRDAGVRLVHETPMAMGEGQAWFQCYDPAGNIIEIVGTV